MVTPVKLLLSAFLLFLNIFVKSQESSGKAITDTLTYAKRFETNKEKYIGKRFSLLLKDMIQMQFKKVKSEFREDTNNPLPSTSFSFSDKDINSENNVIMIIKWKPDNTATTPLEFFEQEHNYRFTPNEKNFLEKMIVIDITVYKS
ncbi:hypothetical protein EG349_10730 [Chryseobacterium shandongense]|uniref:Uncharacterized protein n=1 Tax=Chryseobacterium shandongense TaxID=1493872 RepID=A0AAD1DLX9_9FLAO|nr:hypothetical protein [Chryseobacterium shandongense]AZA87231.1 hypothetical protein EG349_10730 [Chryseobacterium shandongense]AZA95730.1 hypothetical protein EG353_09185 [Chryseobacterium shandongense]